MNSIKQLGIQAFPKKMPLYAFFMLVFWCFSSPSSHAQSLQPSQSSSSYNWKTAEDATNILIAQVSVLNQQMPGISAGTPLYDNTLRRIAYFKAILQEIQKGATVGDALELSLTAAATLGFEKEASYTPKFILKALQSETRVLLTN